MKNRNLTQSEKLLERAERSIPGCAQTRSKSYTQYVKGVSPLFLERGKGCRVWDVDGNEYIDYVQGLLPNILGYANDEVNQAVFRQMERGVSFTLPHPVEIELAEKLIEIIPCAEMVRFGKNGSDATAGAVRAARAFTKRERIARCGYHGWHDWYVGSTEHSAGVPQSTQDLTHLFEYNSVESLDRILTAHPGEFAAVIMEPVIWTAPEDQFLESVKDLAHQHGALLIYDEICCGFHFGLGGAQKRFGVTPDLACFGKAMANGFPLSCIVGRADLMKIFEEIFYSMTFGGEAGSLAASLAVIHILQTTDALQQIEENGTRLKNKFNRISQSVGLEERVSCQGLCGWTGFAFQDKTGKMGHVEKSLFQQETVKRGLIILGSHNVTAAHDSDTIEETIAVYREVLPILAEWFQADNLEQFLEGDIHEPIFKAH